MVILGGVSAPGSSTELAEELRPDLVGRLGARSSVLTHPQCLDRAVDQTAQIVTLGPFVRAAVSGVPQKEQGREIRVAGAA
jgi:hypothetical protein